VIRVPFGDGSEVRPLTLTGGQNQAHANGESPYSNICLRTLVYECALAGLGCWFSRNLNILNDDSVGTSVVVNDAVIPVTPVTPVEPVEPVAPVVPVRRFHTEVSMKDKKKQKTI
jgi:hypothetical protein